MTQCETCCFYNYDEEHDEYICDVDPVSYTHLTLPTILLV